MKSTEIWNVAQGVAAALNVFLGGFDGGVYALIAFVCADFVTGVFAAFIRKELWSKVGAREVVKKVTIFIIIGVGNLADMYLLGNEQALRTALLFFYASNELVSLVENCSVIGLPIPRVLVDVLAQIKKKSGEQSEFYLVGQEELAGQGKSHEIHHNL